MPFDANDYNDYRADKPPRVNRWWSGITIEDVLRELRLTLVLILLGVAVYHSPEFVHTVIHTVLYIWGVLFILLVSWLVVCFVQTGKK